jgi:hypothetical protein
VGRVQIKKYLWQSSKDSVQSDLRLSLEIPPSPFPSPPESGRGRGEAMAARRRIGETSPQSSRSYAQGDPWLSTGIAPSPGPSPPESGRGRGEGTPGKAFWRRFGLHGQEEIAERDRDERNECRQDAISHDCAHLGLGRPQEGQGPERLDHVGENLSGRERHGHPVERNP